MTDHPPQQRKRASIVLQTAIISALFSAALCGITFYALFIVQQRVHREQLFSDIQENVKRSTVFILEYLYLEGNWLYLQAHQKSISETPNILYSYFVDQKGHVEIGRTGLDSADTGKEAFPWEPHVSVDIPEGYKETFEATPELAQEYSGRIKAGELVGFIAVPIKCSSMDRKCGQLRMVTTFTSIEPMLQNLKWTLILAGIFFSIITALVVYLVVRRKLGPIRQMSAQMRLLATKEAIGVSPLEFGADLVDAEETRYFKESFNLFAQAYERTTKLEGEVKVSRSMTAMARQVAHDIRSPLAALDALASVITEVAEEKRILLRSAIMRIRDIANNLISFHSPKALDAINDGVGSTLVLGVLTELISEKRLQFGHLSQLTIDERISNDVRSAFISVNRNGFQRAVSNILNNAIESLQGKGGQVTVSARVEDEFVVISISDTGVGMTPEILEKVLSEGGSFNKTGGTGLGLRQARDVVTAAGGRLRLHSDGVGKGTVLDMNLPRKDAPDWFARTLTIIRGSQVIILDDDESIHQVWRQRLTPAICQQHALTLHHFRDVRHFTADVPELLAKHRGAVKCFVDFELIGSSVTGLQAIENIGAQHCATLITSHYDDQVVQRECLRIGVKMLPKESVSSVDLAIVEPVANVACVLVDDDVWIREAWELKGKQSGMSILTCAGPSELLLRIDSLDVNIPVFIDYHLGQGEMTGAMLAQRLNESGFKKLYFQTGMSPEHIAESHLVIGITGKTPPEWLFGAKT